MRAFRWALAALAALVLMPDAADAQTAGWEYPTVANYTATAADNGKVLASDNVPGGSITITLPTPSVVGQGWLMGFSEGNGHGIIVNTPTGSIFILTGQKTLTSLTAPSNTNYEYFALQSDGTQFRLLVATTKTAQQNGLIGNAGGTTWTYLFSTGYSATPVDNGATLSAALAGGPTTITLPSTPLIPNGWVIDIVADGGNDVTVNVNGVSGGAILKTNKVSSTTQMIKAGAYNRIYYTGRTFQAITLTPGVQTLYSPANTGWGDANLLVSSVNTNAAVGATINNAAPATTIFPTGVTGYGLLNPSATGNAVFAAYGEADLTTNGTAVAGEFDCMNYIGPPDTNLPSAKAIGTTFNNCEGLQIGAGGTYGGSIGIQIGGALGGVYGSGSAQRWNTGIYMGGGIAPGTSGTTAYGLFIDADNVGPGTSAVLQNYGNGINLQLGTNGPFQGNNAVITTLDTLNRSHWSVRQNGATFMGNNATSQVPINNAGNLATLNVVGQGAFATYASDSLSGITIGSPGIWQDHARGTQAAPLAVAISDTLGQYIVSGYDGAAYFAAAGIRVNAGGAVTAGVVPGSMQLMTTNVGGVLTSRLTLDAAGSAIIGAPGGGGEGRGTLNVESGYYANGNAGVSCNLTTLHNLIVTAGIVTTCN